MDNAFFDEKIAELMNYCNDLVSKKNKEYSPKQDKVANFRNAALFSGQTMEQVLFGYLLKHWDSIKTMCLSGDKYEVDKWKEKLGDNIIYSAILYAIVCELEESIQAESAQEDR